VPLLNTAEFRVLGGPPSFDSITRDTYMENQRFQIGFTLKLLKSIVSACEYLHSMGIMHGDVYAHNVLTNTGGDALLTDFGASSFLLECFSPEDRLLLEKMEVRAFGCLVEDLMTRIPSNEQNDDFITRLNNILQKCTNPQVSDRPTFFKLREILFDLKAV
jgi:predicted unusual protein kinase regulating ubiquinone biosynthesis (AarF/ABC1/UbiB family)